MGYGEPQVGDVCLGYLGLGSGHAITPGSQDPKEFGSMLETEFLGWATKEEVIYIGGDDLGLGQVSVGPFVKKKKWTKKVGTVSEPLGENCSC